MSDRKDDLDEAEQVLSKTKKKSELEALRALAAELVALSTPHLEKLTLPEDVRAEIDEARRLDSKNALRRAIGRVGQLLTGVDAVALRAEMVVVHRGAPKPAPASTLSPEAAARIETLLTGGDEALFALSSELGRDELQTLRQAVRAAKKKLTTGAPRDACLVLVQDALVRLGVAK